MRRAVLVGVALLAIAFGGYALFHSSKTAEEVEGTHHASHQDASFYGDIAASSTEHIPGIRGFVVSHHLLVADEIASTFAAAASDNVRTLVIIGPDHFRQAHGAVSVSRYAYETPWGRVEPDLPLIDDLIASGIARQDEYPFEIEHSVASLVPYARYHFPNAKIVPILMDRAASASSSDALGRFLSENLADESMVVASVDFSHHLGATAAAFHDAKSIPTVLSFDYGSLERLEVDSPASLRAVMRYLDERGAQRAVSGAATDSARVLGTPESEDVTSYLFASFASGNPDQAGVVSILGAGDVMLGRDVAKKLAQDVDLFERFRGVEGNFLKGFDMFAINLEGPITESKGCQPKELSFAFLPPVARMLAENGVTHANLSNNHSFDCYAKGVADTKQYLADAGVRFIGGGSLMESARIEEVGGKRVALLGIDRTIAPVREEEVYARVRALAGESDIVIVETHWGTEYAPTESESQRMFAHGLIDAGADAVLGHHPHVVEPIEFYRGKPIFYSLGNFIFDQGGRETATGIAAGLVFDSGSIRAFVFPYTLNRDYQPGLMPFLEAQAYCRTLGSGEMARTKDACVFESLVR